jgi:cytochrome c553
MRCGCATRPKETGKPKIMNPIIRMAALFVLALPVHASDRVTLQVIADATLGQYLATGTGRPVYAFSTDTPTKQGQPANITCISAKCRDAWQLVTVSDSDAPRAGEGIDATQLGTIAHDGQKVVTYNGWPLYVTAQVTPEHPPQSREITGFGGVWTLLEGEDKTAAVDMKSAEAKFAEACAQCHGRTGRGMASFPALTGKEAGYISTRLRQYRAGDTVGPNSALMRPVAARLSDADIENLAAYIALEFP